MHRECVDEEVLMDSEGNVLCPYDAALAALDWFDNIISLYSSSFSDEQLNEIIDRLNTYIEMLRNRRKD